MSTTTEREIKVANGLGDADASQVLAGATFSSEEGFNIEGTFVPSAVNIAYDNTTSGMASTNVQGAIDEISETASNLPSAGTKITGVLTAGQTTVTLTSDEITSDAKLNAVYTSIYGVSLRSATFGEGSLTLEFPMQEEDMTVMALIDASVSSGGNENDGTMTANNVSYDNSVSGMSATNIQEAIDEVKTDLSNKADTSHNHNDSYYTKTEVDNKVGGLITSGTTDLTAGTSELASGVIYAMYE